MAERDFIIVSGLSGSGKSTVLQALEDQGYYCADNLPATLLVAFGAQLAHREGQSLLAAVSIDVRNRDFLRPCHRPSKIYGMRMDCIHVFCFWKRAKTPCCSATVKPAAAIP